MKYDIKLGALFTILSALSYTLVAVIVKRYAYNVNVFIMVFIQLTVCLIILSLVLIKKRHVVWQPLLHSPNKKIHFLRTISSLSNGYLFYYSLKFLPLVNGVLLINTAPLLVPLLGLLFFHKKIYYQVLIAITLGFIGVVLVLDPHTNGFNLASFIAIGAATCMGLGGLLIRKASENGDDSFTTSFYFFLFGTIISGLVSIPFWQAISFSIGMIIILSGVLLFIVQYTYSLAFQHADATFVSSIYYSNIIFAAILNIVIFNHYPPLLTYLGTCLIIIGGIFTVYIQQKINKRLTAQNKSV